MNPSRPPHVVIEVGANIGMFTLKQALLPGVERVFAFEPNPMTFRRLLRNLELNDAGNVVAINKGVARKTGSAWLETGSTSVCSRLAIDTENLAGGDRFQVETVAMDEFAAHYGIDRVDLMTVDVEGSEVEFLHGAQALLAVTQSVILECHSDFLKAEVEQTLSGLSYQKVGEVVAPGGLPVVAF